jgi:hypothetical protein
MTGIGIALGLSLAWGLGLALTAVLWIHKERSDADLKKRREDRQPKLPFGDAEHTSLVGHGSGQR